MKALFVVLVLAGLAAGPVRAQHEGHAAPAPDPHAGHDMSAMGDPALPPAMPPPPEAFSGPRHAADTIFDPAEMARMREDLRAENGDFITWWVMADQLESRSRDGGDGYVWDAQGWYGGDINKLWLKSEGEGGAGESPENLEVQALWSRAISPWWDIQGGLRYDFRPDPGQAYMVIGLQGLVPYQNEVDAAAFLSEDGDLSARVEAEYDLRITQRLILQPRVELDIALQEVPETGTGSGLTSAEAGVRLRYEFAREFAPYIGLEYERSFGATADYARLAGEEAGGWSFLAGLRIWF